MRHYYIRTWKILEHENTKRKIWSPSPSKRKCVFVYYVLQSRLGGLDKNWHQLRSRVSESVSNLKMSDSVNTILLILMDQDFPRWLRFFFWLFKTSWQICSTVLTLTCQESRPILEKSSWRRSQPKFQHLFFLSILSWS